MPEIEEFFYLMDRGSELDRIIILGRDSLLEHITASGIWYADGTFVIAPHISPQVQK